MVFTYHFPSKSIRGCRFDPRAGIIRAHFPERRRAPQPRPSIVIPLDKFSDTTHPGFMAQQSIQEALEMAAPPATRRMFDISSSAFHFAPNLLRSVPLVTLNSNAEGLLAASLMPNKSRALLRVPDSSHPNPDLQRT